MRRQSVRGLETVTDQQARAFAQAHQRVQNAELVAHPFARPTGWVILAGGAVTTGLIGPLLADVVPPPASAAASFAIAMVIMIGAWVLAGRIVERRAFQRAPYRWLIRFGARGAAGAYARLDRKRRLTVYSVWATPQGHGHGSKLLEQIIRDTAGTDLWLVADNRRAARFYQRHGFAPVRRELLGQRMVLRRQGPGIHAEGPV